MAANTGIPHAVAAAMTARDGISAHDSADASAMPKMIGSARPEAARRRPRVESAACQTMRPEMTANATGRMLVASHEGIPQAVMPPAACSTRTRSAPAIDSHAAIPLPTADVKIRMGPRSRTGRKAGVESASSRSERPASAAPRSATHSVNCWTRTITPGMLRPSMMRAAASPSGRSAIAANTTTDSASSNCRAIATDPSRSSAFTDETRF